MLCTSVKVSNPLYLVSIKTTPKNKQPNLDPTMTTSSQPCSTACIEIDFFACPLRRGTATLSPPLTTFADSTALVQFFPSPLCRSFLHSRRYFNNKINTALIRLSRPLSEPEPLQNTNSRGPTLFQHLPIRRQRDAESSVVRRQPRESFIRV